MDAVYAVFAAAGLGTRMGSGSAPKQFLELDGVPILIHSVRAFAAVPSIRALYIAVRAGEQPRLEALLREYAASLAGTLELHIVEGGDTRQESVARALAAIACDDHDVVLVHDAVRPLVEPVAIERVIAAVRRYGAAILAMPATDTIKQVERTQDGALITATIPRENIVQAQTPQGARAALLRRAVAEAEADGFAGTDEASLLERAGSTVAVVPGSASNLKITHATDLPLAEWYLAQRRA
jgi:2-C-methyl-D-erythritol 4-phosphate cytidylyltransferase